MNKLIIFFCCLFLSANNPKKTDSLSNLKKMSIKTDTIPVEPFAGNHIYNAKVLEAFFQKLNENENNPYHKINIVHIGDSHIQGDLMTNKIRKNLQEKYGNAGRGFVFPYQLAKTNGSYNERFSSNRKWESYRNIHPANNSPVGLSGIGLWRDTDGFAIQLDIKDKAYRFNTIKIITPQNQNMFDLATSSLTKRIETSEPKIISHKVKKGEAISIIADKYNVSVADIKRVNNLKSTSIRAGRTLKIPTNERKPKTISRSEFVTLDIQSDELSHYYNSDKALDKIYLIPGKEAKDYELNGIVLENNSPGITYSSIGVNGSKYSDYNKYPLFFEQLKALKPDLLVFSLGTNESYDKMEAREYMKDLLKFINNIKKQNINVPIIITTPPPSLLRKKPNTYIADYTKAILEAAVTDDFSVIDMYNGFGGHNGISDLKKQKLIGPDWVHYSKKGYEKQGDFFSQALVSAYDNFKAKK